MNVDQWRRNTRILLGGTIAVWLSYEVYAILKGGERATISYNVLADAMRQPIIAALGGGLLVHFFWSQEKIVYIQRDDSTIQEVKGKHLMRTLRSG